MINPQLSESFDEPSEDESRLQEMRKEKLQSLVGALVQKRKKAIEFRKKSGIETEWDECTDAFEGVDDANRGTETLVKPSSADGRVTVQQPNRQTRSTVFLNITRPYVEGAAARVADMLLPTDDRNWAIKPTPIPELDEYINQGNESAAQAKSILDEATMRAEKAQDRIDDWLTECQYNAQIRQQIDSAARLGTGVIKGPIPTKKKKKSVNAAGNVLSIEIKEALQPVTKFVDVRNLYPDPACGSNIHNGSYIFEADYWSAKQLKACIGGPGYLDDEIMAVLAEGPSKRNLEVRSERRTTSEDDLFPIWHFHGDIDVDALESAGCECGDMSKKTVPAIFTMANDRIIKASMSHLDSGEFPYDVMVWQRRDDYWAGIGVVKQMSAAQRMLNSATRNMMDNAGVSAGPQFIVDSDAIEPADGVWELTPRKFWNKIPNALMDDVRKAFTSIVIDTRQVELMNIIQFSLEMAERLTAFPLLMQGQAEPVNQETATAAIIKTNASSTVLRRIARTFDDMVTEPHIRRYYEYLMNDPDVSEDEKGEYCIDARGSSALVERAIQDQTLLQLGGLVANPVFGGDPQLWLEETLRAKRIDPKRIMLSDEKKAEMQQAQQPADPRIEVANINAQMRMEIEQLKADVAMQKSKNDMDRDMIYAQGVQQRTESDAMLGIEELRLRRELAMLDYANRRNMTLEEINGKLAGDKMKLDLQRELAGKDGRGPQVATPPTEPEGKARDGRAYQE